MNIFNISNISKWILLCVSPLLLCHCAVKNNIQDPEKIYAQYQISHLAINNFQISGLVNIKNTKQNQFITAQFIWTQNNNKTSIELYGPMGLDATYLSLDLALEHQGAILITPDHKKYQADNAEQIMEEILGWSVPVNGLRYWIFGVPENFKNLNTPASPEKHSLNSSGFLKTLNQDSWEINYLAYKNSMPEKIILTRDGLVITVIVHGFSRVYGRN